MDNLTTDGYFKATKQISNSSIAELPNISSERVSGDSNKCRVLVSVESGKKLKTILKNKIKDLSKELFDSVATNIKTQSDTLETMGDNTADPIAVSLSAINNIQGTLTTSVKKFNENLKNVPFKLDGEGIPCKIFVHSKKANTYIPVAGTYITKINLGKKVIIIDYKDDSAAISKYPSEINFEHLCIGGLGGPPESKITEPQTKHEEVVKTESKAQEGGNKNKTRIIRLNNYGLDGSEYDHCE